MNISFELVARDQAAIDKQLAFIREQLPFVSAINIPDLLRFPIRSWDVAPQIPAREYRFIPHFRAIDFDLRSTRLQDIIARHGLREVLLVSGDPPPDMSFKIYDTRVLDLIARIRQDCPGVKIYAGFDSYRSSVRDEIQYMNDKLAAGADALFSQPFFDMRLLEIYGEHISGERVYWGVSPVVTEQSQRYWETMNNVVFPADFRPDYDWNIAFAGRVVDYCRRTGANLYFMPIRINLEKYFSGVRQAIDA